MIHLDTHAAVWLYTTVDHVRFPAALLARLESEPMAVSPMVRLELTLLHEVGRVTDEAGRIVRELGRALDLQIDRTPFGDVIEVAATLSFTRDPFDRIIAAQAVAAGAELVTKDRHMRDHVAAAVWD